MEIFQTCLSILSGIVAGVLLIDVVRDRQNTNLAFFGLVAVEVGLVVQFVWGIGQLFGDHDGVPVAPYLGYLFGALFMLPIAYLWAASEKSRSGTAVVLVAVLVVPVLLLRLHDLRATGV